jgi:hypothetical protein
VSPAFACGVPFCFGICEAETLRWYGSAAKRPIASSVAVAPLMTSCVSPNMQETCTRALRLTSPLLQQRTDVHLLVELSA